MSSAPWSTLALFAFVSSITPGPNNLLATSSGARFGLRRTLPQVAGVTFGFTIVLWVAASGVATLVGTHPAVAVLMAAAGYGYLLWLSFTLIGAAVRRETVRESRTRDRPMTFWQSALFQFANPKAWMMALSVASGFLIGDRRSMASIAAVGLLFAAINFPCVGAWAAMGAHFQAWLNDAAAPWRSRIFNASMGVTLLATTAGMIAMR